MSARIIYLNGTSSSGKSSIAAVVQGALPDLYLHIELDSFLRMVPPRGWERPGGAVLTPPQDGRGFEVDFGPLCQQLFSGFHRALGALAATGNNLIVDDVLVERRWLREAVEHLAPYDALFVGVRCPVEVAEARERERERGDRMAGTARGQAEHVHVHGVYDVEVDTALLTPDECAARILQARESAPRPRAFERLSGIL